MFDIEKERAQFAALSREETPQYKDYSDREIAYRVAPAAFLGWCQHVQFLESQEGEEELGRCKLCDGTGDVTRADGEWLGVCGVCDAAKKGEQTDEMPELPQPARVIPGSITTLPMWLYTDCQMEAYARAAIARKAMSRLS
jgi:hypothetical protein